MFDVNLVLSYRAEAKDDAYLTEILPPFAPKRGARTPEKIAEQQAAHFDEWKEQAMSNPHCIDVTAAHLVAYFARKGAGIPSRHEYRIDSIADVEAAFGEIRNHVGLATYRWFGENTAIAAKAWQFQLMARGVFLQRGADPAAFYGSTHYELGSLLKAGNPPIDIGILLEKYLPANAKQYYQDNKPEDPLANDVMLTELAFIAVGELPADILRSVSPKKKKPANRKVS